MIRSYETNGSKLSISDYIYNLSPDDTPFLSLIDDEPITQTFIQWQTDSLKKASKNSNLEGSESKSDDLSATRTLTNHTQILRKVVKVTDTAKVIKLAGRSDELKYQIDKKLRELKTDIEYAFLHNKVGVSPTKNTQGVLTGYRFLVSHINEADPDTGAITHRDTIENTGLIEKDLSDMFHNLYMCGSNANTVMFHPKHAAFFSSLAEKGQRVRVFKNVDSSVNLSVGVYVDAFNREYKLIPNRLMPTENIYFFNPGDFKSMTLRPIKITNLTKNGSSDVSMIETELSLRLSNPFAAGILDIRKPPIPPKPIPAFKRYIAMVGGNGVEVKELTDVNRADGVQSMGTILNKYLPLGLQVLSFSKGQRSSIELLEMIDDVIAADVEAAVLYVNSYDLDRGENPLDGYLEATKTICERLVHAGIKVFLSESPLLWGFADDEKKAYSVKVNEAVMKLDIDGITKITIPPITEYYPDRFADMEMCAKRSADQILPLFNSALNPTLLNEPMHFTSSSAIPDGWRVGATWTHGSTVRKISDSSFEITVNNATVTEQTLVITMPTITAGGDVSDTFQASIATDVYDNVDSIASKLILTKDSAMTNVEQRSSEGDIKGILKTGQVVSDTPNTLGVSLQCKSTRWSAGARIIVSNYKVWKSIEPIGRIFT